jgi:hypothetical protein
MQQSTDSSTNQSNKATAPPAHHHSFSNDSERTKGAIEPQLRVPLAVEGADDGADDAKYGGLPRPLLLREVLLRLGHLSCVCGVDTGRMSNVECVMSSVSSVVMKTKRMGDQWAVGILHQPPPSTPLHTLSHTRTHARTHAPLRAAPSRSAATPPGAVAAARPPRSPSARRALPRAAPCPARSAPSR